MARSPGRESKLRKETAALNAGGLADARPDKHPAGRPTKYNPEWCEKLPDMFRDGQSVLEVAVNLGICRDQMYEYAKLYPSFSDALTRGREIAQAWWERQGREGLFDVTEFGENGKPIMRKAISSPLWAKNVACRFRNDWTDKQEIEHSGAVEISTIKRVIVKPGKGNG